MLAYSIKVALMYDKRTYRVIDILENQSLADLHHAIFDAFNRYDEHLYSYFLTRKAMKSTRNMYDAPQYIHPMGIQDSGFFSRKEQHNAKTTKIGKLDLREKDKMYYLFDFGDSWWHELTVLKIRQTKDHKDYPKIVKIVGESPEQYPDEEDDEDM